VAQAALPHLKASRGSLILMCSAASFFGTPEGAVYSATKAGVLNFVQAIRLENARSGIHIGAICPTFVETPMVSAEARQTNGFKRLGIAHTADTMASIIVQAIERRAFITYGSFQARCVHWLALNVRIGEFVFRQLSS
jgi:short-subunit dehydrogenase